MLIKKTILLAFLMNSFGLLAQNQASHLMQNIQEKISWKTSKDSLEFYIHAMEEMKAKKPNPYLNYWHAYAKYIRFSKFNLKNKDESEKAERTLEEAVTLIEEIPSKTSDHYALWSLIGGLHLNFSNTLMLPIKAAKVSKNAEKAIELNPKNIRGYVALGIYDFFTPKMFGGMKIAEQNFKKALSLSDKIDPNPYAPTWGKEDAYLFLIKFYIAEKRIPEAKKYLSEAIKLYPNVEMFKNIQTKLTKDEYRD
jgi:tetratricopeptide (TPR) repeat protein